MTGIAMDLNYLDLDDLLARVAEGLVRDYGFDGCSIALWKADEDVLVNHYAQLPAKLQEMEAAYRSFRFQPNAATIAGLAFTQRAPQIIDTQSVEQHSQTIKDAFYRWGFGTFAAWPIMRAGSEGKQEPVGVFSGLFEHGKLDRAVVDEIATKLAQAAPSIEATLDQEQCEVLDPELAEQHHLLHVLTDCNCGTSLAETAAPMARHLQQRFGFDLAGVLLRDGASLMLGYSSLSPAHLHLQDAWQAHAGQRYDCDVSDGLAAVVYVQNTHFMVHDVQKMAEGMFSIKDRAMLASLQTVHTYLLLPLRLAGKPMGVLSLASLSQPLTLGAHELATLQLFADFLATALARHSESAA